MSWRNAAPSMCMQSVGERPAISEREADSSSENVARHAHTDTAHDRRNPRQESHRGPAIATRESEALDLAVLLISVRRCCARHRVHGQSSPTACVWSDELIAQPPCYWVTQQPCIEQNPDKRQGTINIGILTTSSAGHSLFKVVPRFVCACAR